MLVIAKYAQADGERKRYRIDYSDWLDSGETVDNVVFTVNKTTSPPLVIDDNMNTPDGVGVQYFISGGVNNTTYEVIATMTTAQGQIREDAIVVVIREPL